MVLLASSGSGNPRSTATPQIHFLTAPTLYFFGLLDTKDRGTKSPPITTIS
jgi:hypothetical protein